VNARRPFVFRKRGCNKFLAAIWLATARNSFLDSKAAFASVSQYKAAIYRFSVSSAGVTTSFVPNPGISGFQPDKRQMRRTLLVRPGHRRLRHQKSACGSRAPIGSN
jgi:hypothetical protein